MTRNDSNKSGLAFDVGAVTSQQPLNPGFRIPFLPPGPGGASFVRGVQFLHHTMFGSTITLLVVSSMIFGIGVILLVLATFSFVRRRRRLGAIKLRFFVLAMLSGMNLLLLCMVHIGLVRPRMRRALECLMNHCRPSANPFQVQAFMKLDGSASTQNSELAELRIEQVQILSQAENLTLLLSELSILMRIRALFPGERPIQRISGLLLLASGASFTLSICLQISNAPQLTPSWSPNQPDGLRGLAKKIGEIYHIHAYLAGYIQILTNVFGTWSFMTKWRYSRNLMITNKQIGKNWPLERLQILINAGLLLGLLQILWCIQYTLAGLDIMPSPLKLLLDDYVLSRFIFHAVSGLYPIATYIAIHWNTPSDSTEVHCVDLFDISERQNSDIPLINLNLGGLNHNAPMDIDNPVANVQTHTREWILGV